MGRIIFTIGFAGRTAEDFFTTLAEVEVVTLVDVRIRPAGQLAGYARKQDLPFFLSRLVPACDYRLMPELAPTQEILLEYRRTRDWSEYCAAFEGLMDARGVPGSLNPADFDRACLLCSEASADKCHRRLVAERLAAAWHGTEIVHL